MVEGHLRQRVTCGRGSPAAAGLSKALAFEPLPQVHTYIHTYTHTYIHRPTYLVGEAAKSTVAATSYALRPASGVLRQRILNAQLVRGARVGVQETVRVEAYLHMRCACLVGMCGWFLVE